MSIKYFYQQQNIGRAKYVINYYDGQKTNKDGSQALDCAIFGIKLKRDLFIKELFINGDFKNTGSSAACYAWFVWEKGSDTEPIVRWL